VRKVKKRDITLAQPAIPSQLPLPNSRYRLQRHRFFCRDVSFCRGIVDL